MHNFLQKAVLGIAFDIFRRGHNLYKMQGYKGKDIFKLKRETLVKCPHYRLKIIGHKWQRIT